MPTPKDVLVLTTSTIQGQSITKYIKPVSAHLVAGTNLFSDFLGGLSDVFGGKSEAYQRQLSALYAEAITLIKNAAFEAGGNCVVGLSVDLDEISGKGKSMFMVTAVGTAVVLDRVKVDANLVTPANDGAAVVSAETIAMLRRKQGIVKEASEGTLELNNGVWEFITANQVKDVFTYLLDKFSTAVINEQYNNEGYVNFRRQLVGYLDAMPETTRMDLAYGAIQSTTNDLLGAKLVGIAEDLRLFDASRIMGMLQHPDFIAQKRALQLVRAEQAFYAIEDKEDLEQLAAAIAGHFTDKGVITAKKQLLSSKEKQVWNCECGKSNDIGSYCSGCGQDIQGFKANEVKPHQAANYLQSKAKLIGEALSPATGNDVVVARMEAGALLS